MLWEIGLCNIRIGLCFFIFEEIGEERFLELDWGLLFFYVIIECMVLFWLMFLWDFIEYELLDEMFNMLFEECEVWCENLFVLLWDKLGIDFKIVDFDNCWWCVCGFRWIVLILVVVYEFLFLIEFCVFKVFGGEWEYSVIMLIVCINKL